MRTSKGIYILFTLLLGGIGGHKFYVGKWFQGLIYLALCWTGIPVALAILDIIIALFKPSDSEGYIYV